MKPPPVYRARLVFPAISAQPPLVVSVISVEELLEGAVDEAAALGATAESLDADIVGADRAAFARLGARYLRFR